MSAICGVVGSDGRAWTDADLGGILRVLAPLGRDAGGSWSGTAGPCVVALAAALRHSTPEDVADSQPAESRDGSLVLVADLRLDNRDELAAPLGLTDRKSVPDSAFVLAAYERWGKAMLERIVGEFALALVDCRRGGVLIARDHVGSRPLVLYRRRGVVAFASTALALTRFEGVGNTLDLKRAAQQLGLVLNTERTFVDGVRAVLPGTALWIGGTGVRRWKWWKPDPHEIVDLGSAAAHERELREAFDQAVAAHLRSIGKVGASVSGGLDSTSAAATAARLLAPGPLSSYTSAPRPGWDGSARPGWYADPSSLVVALTQLHPNIDARFIHIEPGTGVFAMHEPLWELGAGPDLNACNALWLHAMRARAATDGVTTLLMGTLGDLYFSADGRDWLASLVRAGRFRTALREARAWSRASGSGTFRVLRDHLGQGMPASLQRPLRAAVARVDPVQEWVRATALRPEIAAELDLGRAVPVLDDRLLSDPRTVSLSVLMNSASAAEARAAAAAQTGVEDRDPTSDRRVIEVAMRQPAWVRRRNGVGRAVVRGAMSDRLPPAVVGRTDRGDQLPDWLDVMTAARAEIAEELDQLEGHATSRQLIETGRLRSLVQHWPDRRTGGVPAVVTDYRLVLLRALIVSRYLRWFERRGAGS